MVDYFLYRSNIIVDEIQCGNERFLRNGKRKIRKKTRVEKIDVKKRKVTIDAEKESESFGLSEREK